MNCRGAKKNISLALDDRLEPSTLQSLQEHLHACPACRAWQLEQSQLADLLRSAPPLRPAPGFHTGLMARVAASGRRPVFFRLPMAVFHPLALRAAMAFILVVSALLGFFLGDRLEAPAAGAGMDAFNRTMNLDAFADAPADSFAAVYDKLLQGELQ